METKDVIYPKPLRLGHNSMEHRIMLPVINHCEVPIDLEVISKPVIVKLSGPLIGVFMSVDHGLIFSPCESVGLRG
jgi:hypothetical protein